MVRPSLLKGLYLVLNAVAMPIGYVVSHVILFAIYFLIFTPIALVFRLIGRDALHRKIDRQAATYWLPMDPHPRTAAILPPVLVFRRTESRYARRASKQANEFQQASREKRSGLGAEFWDFLKHNKKWWLLPIVILLLLLGLLVAAGGGTLPFLYTFG